MHMIHGGEYVIKFTRLLNSREMEFIHFHRKSVESHETTALLNDGRPQDYLYAKTVNKSSNSSIDDAEIQLPQPGQPQCSDREEEANIELSLDGVFQRIGYSGWFQIRFLILKLIFEIPSVFSLLPIIFVGLTPEWMCSEDKEYNDIIMMNDTNDSKCYLYEHNDNCTPLYTDRFYSIAQQWNLVCNQSYLINLTQSGLFLGYLIGSYVLGTLGDLFGRRKLLIGNLAGLTIIQIVIALSPNIYVFAIGRFIVGFFAAGSTASYIIFCEMSGPFQRSLIAVLCGIVFALLYGPLALSAYLLRDWKWFTGLSAILTFLCLLLYRYIPESPRWLLVNDKVFEAKKALINIGNVNKRPLPSEFTIKIPPKPPKSFILIALFRTRRMRLQMLVQMFEWFSLVVVYYSLSLGVGSFSNNIYLAFTLSGLVEIPSYLFVFVFLQKIGRKWTNIGFLLVSGIACLLCSFSQMFQIESSGHLTLGLALIGKFAISGAFGVVYTYTPELLPTDFRSSGMGIVNVCARFGGVLTPLLLLLENQVSGLPMLIMGVLGIVTSVLCLYLPETLNAPLLNTVAEVQKTRNHHTA